MAIRIQNELYFIDNENEYSELVVKYMGRDAADYLRDMLAAHAREIEELEEEIETLIAT